jgi:hypothetical protein
VFIRVRQLRTPSGCTLESKCIRILEPRFSLSVGRTFEALAHPDGTEILVHFLSLSSLWALSMFTKNLNMALRRFKVAKVRQGSSVPKSNTNEASLLTINK